MQSIQVQIFNLIKTATSNSMLDVHAILDYWKGMSCFCITSRQIFFFNSNNPRDPSCVFIHNFKCQKKRDESNTLLFKYRQNKLKKTFVKKTLSNKLRLKYIKT